MTMCRGVIFAGDGTYEIATFPIPEPLPGGAVLRVEAVGLCGRFEILNRGGLCGRCRGNLLGLRSYRATPGRWRRTHSTGSPDGPPAPGAVPVLGPSLYVALRPPLQE